MNNVIRKFLWEKINESVPDLPKFSYKPPRENHVLEPKPIRGWK